MASKQTQAARGGAARETRTRQGLEYRALLDAAVDAIIVIDHLGVIQEFSQAAQQVFGYAPEEIIGRNVRELMPGPYHSEHDGYLQRYVGSRDPHIIGIGREVRAKRKDGSVFPWDLAVGQVPGMEPPRFIGFIRDITARKQAEEQLRRSEAELRLAQELANLLTRAIAQQENALSVLLGGYPRAILRGVVLVEQFTPPTPVGLTTDILQRRPDIQAAEQFMISANAEVGVAVANFFPRIGLAALFGAEAPETGDILDSNFNVWSIGGFAAGPLFQGGRLRATYRARQAFWDETISQYKGTVLVALRETSDALVAQQTLAEQRAALQSQVRALREAVDLALARYQGGRATYFEVLDAEQQLFPSEDALPQTQRDQLLAVVNLYKALGGGWNLVESQWANPPPWGHLAARNLDSDGEVRR